jgi:hypothetical protein
LPDSSLSSMSVSESYKRKIACETEPYDVLLAPIYLRIGLGKKSG